MAAARRSPADANDTIGRLPSAIRLFVQHTTSSGCNVGPATTLLLDIPSSYCRSPCLEVPLAEFDSEGRRCILCSHPRHWVAVITETRGLCSQENAEAPTAFPEIRGQSDPLAP